MSVVDAGIHPMLHPSFLAPVLAEGGIAGGGIAGGGIESKTGREAIMDRVVIDATGDADVAHRAGTHPAGRHRPRRPGATCRCRTDT